MAKKQLEKFTAAKLIRKYEICGEWADRLREIFPKDVSFTIKDILNIQEDYDFPLSRIAMQFFEFSKREMIIGLKEENARDITDGYWWKNEAGEALMGIAWMILENGYDL